MAHGCHAVEPVADYIHVGKTRRGKHPTPPPTPAPWFVNCPAFTLDNHKNGRGVCSPGFGTIIACPFFQGLQGPMHTFTTGTTLPHPARSG